MSYVVRWDEEALDDLRKLGKAEAVRIVKKVDSHLKRDPLALGKPLTASLKGLYRYRIGDHRVIYQVIERELMVAVVRVGHRRNVYK